VDKTRLSDWIEIMNRKSLDSISKALQQVLSRLRRYVHWTIGQFWRQIGIMT
jgi:uncharacterized phage-associated protein